MWWYNILGDNEGRISHLLRLDPITAGYILLTDNLVALKRENSEPISIVKRTEWREFIDYFGRSIEDDPSKVGKKNVHFPHIGYISITSYVNNHISRHHLEKKFNLEPPKLRLYQLTKKLAAKIAPHISSAMRGLGVVFDKSILYRSTMFVGSDRSGHS